MKKINITIPFAGFYESMASAHIDDALFLEWKYQAGLSEDVEDNIHEESDIPNDKQDAYYDYCSEKYPQYKKDFVERYTDNFAKDIKSNTGVTIIFSDPVIDSPKEYNFRTDRIFCDADYAALKALYDVIDKAILAKMIQDNFTSRPGFDSFYANDIADVTWSDPAEYDHNQWSTVLNAYRRQYNVTEYELYD